MLRTTDEAFKRMEVEQQELSERCEALGNFLKDCRTSKVHDISIDDIHLLEEQYRYMLGYERVLKIRIARVKGTY